MKTRTIKTVAGVALGMTLIQTAGMAQTFVYLTNSFTNYYPTNSTYAGTPSATTGLQSVINGEYAYCDGGPWTNKGVSLLQDPNMIFPGNTNGACAQIQSNIILGSGGTCWFDYIGNSGNIRGENAGIYCSNIADFGFWIYFTNTTLVNSGGNLGRIAFNLDSDNFNVQLEQNVEFTIPTNALGHWYQIDAKALNPNFAADLGALSAALPNGLAGSWWWEYDNFGNFAGDPNGAGVYPFTNIFWIANPYVVATQVAPPPPSLTSIVPAYPGLTAFTGVGAPSSSGSQEYLKSSAEYTWVNGTFPVSYSFTVNSWPVPAGDPVSANIYLAQGASGAEYSPQTVQSNVVAASLSQQAAGGVTWSLSWKTNAPTTALPAAVATISNATAIGTWTLTFNSVTNVTLSGPKAISANFNLSDPYGAVALDFANTVELYFGVACGNAAACNDHVSFANFNVSNIPNAFSDIFSNDNGSVNTSIWDSMEGGTSAQLLQVVSPGNPYWITWTLPASGYSLYVTPSLNPGSVTWTKATNNTPFNASTNFYQLINANDLPNGSAAFLTLRNP